VAVLVMFAVCMLVRVRLGGMRVLVCVRRVAARMLMRRIVVRVLVRMRFFFVRVRMSMVCHLRDSLNKAVSRQRSVVSIFIVCGCSMCDVSNSSKKLQEVKLSAESS
jgi:hypothetical protein